MYYNGKFVKIHIELRNIGLGQVTPYITLKIVTPSNNLLLNSYFENIIVGLHVLYDFNIHANFHANRM